MPLQHLNFNDDVTSNCISRILVHHHQTLALTSQTMPSFISTRDFFELWRKHSFTQLIVYCALGKNQTYSWYSLGMNPEKKKTNYSARMFSYTSTMIYVTLALIGGIFTLHWAYTILSRSKIYMRSKKQHQGTKTYSPINKMIYLRNKMVMSLPWLKRSKIGENG